MPTGPASPKKDRPKTVSNLPESAEAPVKATSVVAASTKGTAETGPAGPGEPESFGVEESPAAGRPAAAPVAYTTRPRIWYAPTKMLPDIGEASFGPPPPQPETVHGPDDRVQVTNTTDYPWRAIASLLITARDNSTWVGTGWFVSPRTLLTAGHCVYIKGSHVPGRDGWVRSIKVMAGRNGNSLPFDAVTSTVFKSVPGWTDNGSEFYDVGAIILPVPLGETVGVFGVAVYPDDDLSRATVKVAGYPADQPSGTLWSDQRQIASVNAQKVYYDIDTAGGQSGAPVFRTLNDGSQVGVAIHAYGGTSTNSGTRINSEVLAEIRSWMA